GDLLYTPGDRLTHAYFPLGGVISLIQPIDVGDSIEVGLVGAEGMFGTLLALGVDASPVRAVVQGAGPALRIDAAALGRELQRSAALQRELDRYIYVRMSQ